MTKDWDAVQVEIRELSFNQKKPLEEVKELMEQKYKFRASTRAYRMKLKEWGFMRHRPRKSAETRSEVRATSLMSGDENERRNRDSSATTEPMAVEIAPPMACEKNSGWQVVANADTVVELTFMGLLSRERDLQPPIDSWAQAQTRASEIVLDMLGAILDNDSQKLEKLIVENINHVNDPIGMPFDTPNSRFFSHPAMNQIVVLQHPDQTLLDIACGMPCGPVVWILLSHGARGSRHPLGTDLALHNAIKNGRPYTVQAMLVPGRSNVNGVPGTTWKPLLQAVFWNCPEVVRILLNRGANIEDAGLSTLSNGVHTALQLCLEYRIANYLNQQAKIKCHQILEMLLDAGANTHIFSGDKCTVSPFEMFITPWQGNPYWASSLTAVEMNCFKNFLKKGANLQADFAGCPCGSLHRRTFEHQVLWHSTPSVARFLIDSFVTTTHHNGLSLLHQLVGSCPDAKRHPADTLRDIGSLLQKGVDPNLADMYGVRALQKCLEQCPAVDLIPRLQLLVDKGADPETEDNTGVKIYAVAARTFEEPVVSEVMEVLISKIRGGTSRDVGGKLHTWSEGRFPISDTPTYEQVMSCTRQTGDFMLNVRSMVPEDVQKAFQRAYLTVASKHFLDIMTKIAKSRILEVKEKEEITRIVSMRKDMDLSEYKFDPALVMALLDRQPIPSVLHETFPEVTLTSVLSHDIATTAVTSLASRQPSTAGPMSPVAHAPFQFNPNNPTLSHGSLDIPKTLQPPVSWLDDFFVTSTTQIRWHDPCAKAKPGDLTKAATAVLEHKCTTCNNSNLLTKEELKRHEVEHAHSVYCKENLCRRRFCAETSKNEMDTGCRDHLFPGANL